MIIKDERVLQEARERPRCERCRRAVHGYLHPHHITGRGQGGGRRLDIRINIVGLCFAPCHDDAHHGRINPEDFYAIVAVRDNLPQAAVEEVIAWLMRTNTKTLPLALERSLRSLSTPAQTIARSILRSAPKS